MRFESISLGVLNGNEVVRVKLWIRAEVMLMDSISFSNYRGGSPPRNSYGGIANGKIDIPVPYQGMWFVVVEYNEAVGAPNATAEVIPSGSQQYGMMKKIANPDRREVRKYELLDKVKSERGSGGIICMCEEVTIILNAGVFRDSCGIFLSELLR